MPNKEKFKLGMTTILVSQFLFYRFILLDQLCLYRQTNRQTETQTQTGGTLAVDLFKVDKSIVILKLEGKKLNRLKLFVN